MTIVVVLLGALMSVTGYYGHQVTQLGERIARIEGRMGLAVTHRGRTNDLPVVNARQLPSSEPASLEEK